MAAQGQIAERPTQDRQAPGSVSYRLATSREDLEQAFALVRDSYVAVGLHDPSKPGVRLTKYHLLPGVRVFVAVASSAEGGGAGAEEQVIGTLTVVPDGALGLPADAVAHAELVRKRRDGARMAEIIALAANERGTQERTVLKLFHLAYEHCRRAGFTDMVASLTERHIGFYRRFLGFEPLGDLNEYTMANGLPVQVHCLPEVGANPLIESRANHLMSDVGWRTFWLNESRDILEQADVVDPWAPQQQRYFFQRCPILSQELDQDAEQVLELEYRRFGALFSGATGA